MAKRKKPKAAKVITVDSNGEAVVGPTPERLKRAGDGVAARQTETGRTGVRMTDSDILGHLASRSVISQDQLAAGERYYKSWYRAGLAASGVVDPERVIVDGGNPEPAASMRLEALGDWASATKAIGKILAHPLIEMVLFEETATVYAMKYLRKRDPKDCRLAAYTVLGLSLDALVMHYMGPKRARSHYAMADGARPVIHPYQQDDAA